MDKGYYIDRAEKLLDRLVTVAIHNKNGQGLLRANITVSAPIIFMSQSTIKMDKGYYSNFLIALLRKL